MNYNYYRHPPRWLRDNLEAVRSQVLASEVLDGTTVVGFHLLVF